MKIANLFLGKAHNIDILKRIFQNRANILRPRANLSASEWAEKNVAIPAGNAIPGMIRFDNAPYQREPLDCYGKRDIYKITLMFGAQTGKTNIMNAGIGYCIEHNPQSQIMMQPTQTDISVWLETKFRPMVDASPYLNKLVAKPRSREGVNNNKMISYPGGNLMFSWAGSPNTIHGRSPAKAHVDEVDRYEIMAGQGHPANLIEQRVATHGEESLIVFASTPSIKGISFIERAFEAGDMRRWHVSCFSCGHEQYFKWQNVHWDKDENGNDLPKTAHYQCEKCHTHWTHSDKIRMNKTGRWIASKPFDGHASFHLPELASNFRNWEQIVRSFLDKVATGDLQAFVNLSLAETWEEKGSVVEPHILAERATDFEAYIPKEVLILTAGVDIQHDRIECELVGWTGENRQSYSVDYKIFYGDVTLPEKHPDSPFKALYDFITTDFRHASGMPMKVACTAIDSGDGTTTAEVYEFCVYKRGKNIYAAKGRGGWNMPIVRTSRAERSRKTVMTKKQSFPLLIVGVSDAKVRILRDLFVDNPQSAGYCHFPKSRDPEYFEQLTAEQLIYRKVKGDTVREWVKIRPRNEALDCRVYALAALTHVLPNYDTLRKRLADFIANTPKASGQEISPPPAIAICADAEQDTHEATQTPAPPIKKTKIKKVILRDGKKEVIYE